MAVQNSNIDEVIEKIIGYSERIDTPFGEMCTLSCDLSSNGRLYQPIEDCVRKLRSHLMQRQQSYTFDGQIAENMYSYSVNTILEFFGLNSKQYQIEECGSHEISPYSYLGKILQINFPNRSYKEQDQNNSNENKRIPQVYVSTNESYSNILPWTFYGCKIHSIDVNKQSEINATQLIDKLSKSSEYDQHIVSLSAVQNMTGQKITNLEKIIQGVLGLRAEMEQRNKNIKIYLCLDITQIVQREKINANEGIYKDVDFFIVQGIKFLGGGFDSTNILISRKESATNTLQPQLPLQDTSNNVLDSLKENNDPTKLYRIALSLQFLESIQFQKIQELEKKNLNIFLSEISAANKDLKKMSVLRNISIQGVISEKTELQFGNLHLNLYVPGSEVFDDENKSYLHPDFVCQMLHDLFGILVTVKRNVKLNDNITMLNVPNSIHSKLESIGSSESMIGCIQLDISFLHKEEEIKYIAQALKLICEKGEEFLRYYDKKTFLMNNFNYEIYDLHLNQMLKVNDTREQVVQKRGQKYDAQIQVAKTVFKNYTRYFSLHDGYTKEKTLQIQKKQPPFCMPPVLQQKSIVKLPDDGNDESILNLQKIAIQKAQEYVKDEIAKLEQERLRLKNLNLQESVIIKPASPPKAEKTEKIVKTEPNTQNDEMERHVEDLIEKRLSEKTRKEKEDMEKKLELMKKEMQEQLEQSSTYKEQFVFEDLQPSVMFKNVLDHREKRNRNLRQIYNNYAKQYIEQLESGKRKKSRFDIVTSKNNKNNNQYAAYPISIDQYLMFCSQFNLFNDQLDINVASQIFSKSLSKSATSKEMHFTEFISSLEKLALVIYYNHQLLITSFDKTEALYQHLQIDDVHVLKQKMAALSSISEDLSASKNSYLNASPNKMNNLHSLRQNKPNSPNPQGLHYLDYDSTLLTESQSPQKKNNNSNKYVYTNQPNQYSVQIQNKPKNKQKLFQNQKSDLQLNDIKNVLGNPSQLFKNESNFLYHEYGQHNSSRMQPYSYSNMNSQQLPLKLGSSQSVSYMSPNSINPNYQNKYSSSSPEKNGIDILNQNQNYAQQHNNSQISPDNRKGYLMNRAKEIEDSEIKKQQNLLNFLQNNMNSNRYKVQKKKL